MLSLNFSPFPVIETGRLLLRSLSMEDLTDLFYLRTNKKVNTYLNKAPDASPEATKYKIKEILGKQEENDCVLWVITFKEDPANLIGSIGCWNITKEHYRAEIGYMLHPNYHRKGLMQEAIETVLDFGFNQFKFHSIAAVIHPDNIASRCILLKNGFVQEAHFKEDCFYNGEFTDTVILSLLRDKKS